MTTAQTTNKSENSAPANSAGKAMGATPVVAAEELDPSRERRPLESYFQEIGGTRTLKREEEVYLAKDLEAATASLRDSLYALPSSAQHVVNRWDALRALSHTGAKLSESAGDEETGEIALRVERAVKKLRGHLEDRGKRFEKAGESYTPTLEKLDAKIAKEMHSAQLSLAVLVELRERSLEHWSEMKRTRKRTKRLAELELQVGVPKKRMPSWLSLNRKPRKSAWNGWMPIRTLSKS